MTAIEISPSVLKGVKRGLRETLPAIRSSVLTESLARGLGYKTQASLIADYSDDPEIQLFDPADFVSRLNQLDPGTCDIRPAVLERMFQSLALPGLCPTSPRIPAKKRSSGRQSRRSMIWQKVMVAGINEAIRRRLFTVRPGDNRWQDVEEGAGAGFHFHIEGHPAYGHVRDAGWDELAIKITLWPTPDVEEWGGAALFSREAAYLAGDIYASGWLERKNGAWLQTNGRPVVYCRQARIPAAAALILERPLGFAIDGPLMM